MGQSTKVNGSWANTVVRVLSSGRMVKLTKEIMYREDDKETENIVLKMGVVI